MTGKVFSSEHAFPSKFLILFRTLSSWGSNNYRPSTPFLYEVASHVKTAIPAIIIIIIYLLLFVLLLLLLYESEFGDSVNIQGQEQIESQTCVSTN